MKGRIKHYYQVLRHQDCLSKFLISRFLFKSGLCRFFLIQRNQYRIRFYPSNLSIECWCCPTYFEEDERILSICLNKGDVFVDVGANIGLLTLRAASLVGSTGRVYSIEPHPRIYRYLIENIRLNRFLNVKTFNLAVGEKEDIVNFTNKRSDDMNRISDDGDIRIPVSTLDRILRNELSVIHFLKVDVEGNEKFVMQGACDVLKKTQCVYFETKEKNFRHNGYTTPELLDVIRNFGFRIFRLVGLQLKDVPPNHVSEHLENFFALRNLDNFLERTGLAISR